MVVIEIVIVIMIIIDVKVALGLFCIWSTDAVRIIHRITQPVGATGSECKGQGRNRMKATPQSGVTSPLAQATCTSPFGPFSLSLSLYIYIYIYICFIHIYIYIYMYTHTYTHYLRISRTVVSTHNTYTLQHIILYCIISCHVMLYDVICVWRLRPSTTSARLASACAPTARGLRPGFSASWDDRATTAWRQCTYLQMCMIYAYVCIYIYICICIHMYTHTHTHTHCATSDNE